MFTPSLFIRDEEQYAIVSGHRKRKKRRKISPPLNIQIQVRAYNDVRIFWEPPEDVELFEYRIVRNGILISRGLETEYIDTNVNGGNLYEYSVVAVNIFGLLSTPISETLPYTLPSVSPLTFVSSYDTVTLSWNAITDPIFKSYRVLKNLQNIYQGSNTQFTVNGLIPGTVYNFIVQVIDLWDNISDNEVEVLVTTDEAPILSQVTGFTLSDVTPDSVLISWDVATEDTFQKYKLYKNDELIYEGILTSFNVNGLSDYTYYVFSIIKVDFWLNESIPSIGSITTPDNTNPTQPIISTLPNTKTINWDPSTDNDSVVSYDVYLDNVFIVNTTGLSYTDNTLLFNQPYTFKVLAVDPSGNKSTANDTVITFTDTTSPTQPTFASITQQKHTENEISWNLSTDNDSVTEYIISRNGLLRYNGLGSNFIDTQVPLLRFNDYTIQAKDASGNLSTEDSFSKTNILHWWQSNPNWPTDPSTITNGFIPITYTNDTVFVQGSQLDYYVRLTPQNVSAVGYAQYDVPHNITPFRASFDLFFESFGIYPGIDPISFFWNTGDGVMRNGISFVPRADGANYITYLQSGFPNQNSPTGLSQIVVGSWIRYRVEVDSLEIRVYITDMNTPIHVFTNNTSTITHNTMGWYTWCGAHQHEKRVRNWEIYSLT